VRSRGKTARYKLWHPTMRTAKKRAESLTERPTFKGH
jgi:hypothetical protein